MFQRIVSRSNRLSPKARIIGISVASVALTGGLLGSVFGISPIQNASAAPAVPAGHCVNYGSTIRDDQGNLQIKHDCNIARPGAIGFTTPAGKQRVGTLAPGKHWFACQVEGRRSTVGSNTNSYWVWTKVLKDGTQGQYVWAWVPATTIVQGTNDKHIPGVRHCDDLNAFKPLGTAGANPFGNATKPSRTVNPAANIDTPPAPGTQRIIQL